MSNLKFAADDVPKEKHALEVTNTMPVYNVSYSVSTRSRPPLIHTRPFLSWLMVIVLPPPAKP